LKGSRRRKGRGERRQHSEQSHRPAQGNAM
jgi:hypothetical protein